MTREKRRQAVGPKQVVYLWGAGATQAEISYLGAQNVNLLMRDNPLGYGVATRILQRLPKKRKSSFISEQGTDIEKLISLLAASNAPEYQQLADQIRKLYYEDICTSLAKAKMLSDPKLAIGLLEMHNDEDFKGQEELTGLITTNHDGLLQLAAQQVHGHVNIGIPFESDELTHGTSSAPVLQLHGSFTWTFGLPLRVSLLRETSMYLPSTVWIPPAILKESKNYPFNKLAGLAYEILSKRCDVLRVVGSSLTQNDWNILSIIFNAQRHMELTKKSPFRVELIMPQEAGVEIAKDCSYLRNITPIGQLTEGNFADYKDEDTAGYRDEDTGSSDMKNPLFYYLKQKIQFHQRRRELGTITPTMAQVMGDTL
jgi:hypothetical protein